MDGNLLAGVGILVSLSSLMQVTALVRVYGIHNKLTEFIKNTDRLLEIYEKRISRLENKHMKE